MYSILIVLMVIASILMCLIVLVQESKGGGLASNFSSANQIVGVRKTTDIVEKTTWGLFIAMVVISVLTAYCVPKASTERSVMERPQQTVPVVPGQGTQFPGGNPQSSAPANGQSAPASEQPAPASPSQN